MSDYQTSIIAKINAIKEHSQGFSKSGGRWRGVMINGTHISEVDFYTLSPEELANAFFMISTRYIRQM